MNSSVLRARSAPLVGTAWMLVFATVAMAAQTGSITLPAGKIKSGLLMHVDARWVAGNGYRPVEVTILSLTGPVAGGREVRVEIYPQDWTGRGNMAGVTAYLEIPDGELMATTTVSLPQERPWLNATVEVHENNRELEDLTGVFGLATYTGANYGWTESRPAMLFIDRHAPSRQSNRISVIRTTAKTFYRKLKNDQDEFLDEFDEPSIEEAVERLIQEPKETMDLTLNPHEQELLPDFRGLASMLPQEGATDFGSRPFQRGKDQAILTTLGGLSSVELLPQYDLPDKWIDLSCFDVTFISMEDLKLLHASYPVKWKSLRDWLATGPTLCVYDVGSQYERLEELEQLLNLAPLEKADQSAERGWNKPAPGSWKPGLDRLSNQLFQNTYWGGAGPAASPQPQMNPSQPSPTFRESFIWREANLGKVAAFGVEDPFPGSKPQWGSLFNTLGPDNWQWHRRHGLSLTRTNSDYWKFLIPGVGTPPVMSFVVLITLFVVMIGPVNFFLLSKAGRLYLLLVTVPLGAAIVTSSLFAYALVSDGLGSQVRVRSYTQLDQRSQRATSWSRQSYFAAIAPSQGLDYPLDTAVYRLLEDPADSASWGAAKPKRHVHWEGSQNLRKGFLDSRVIGQFVAVRAAESEIGLTVKRASGGLEVVNGLDAAIKRLYLNDGAGQIWQAVDQTAEAEFAPHPVALEDAISELRKLLNDNAPAHPVEFDPQRRNEALRFGSRRNYYYNNIDNSQSAPSMQYSVLEQRFSKLGFNTGPLSEPRTYIAIVDDCPETPLGLKDAKRMESLQVIVGKY